MKNHNLQDSKLAGHMRSHTCGELRATNEGETVTLCGWLNKDRNLGGLHFIDIRDKYGVTQLSFDEYKGDIGLVKKFSLESVIMATRKLNEEEGLIVGLREGVMQCISFCLKNGDCT